MKGVDEGKGYWGKGARMQADPGFSYSLSPALFHILLTAFFKTFIVSLLHI